MTIAADLEFMTAAEFAVIFQGRARQLAWFLGAGASAAGGIPTGYDMITEFKARVFCRDTGLAFREIDPADPLWLARIEDHAARSPTLPPPGSPDEYSAYFEEIHPRPGRSEELHRREAEPSITVVCPPGASLR